MNGVGKRKDDEDISFVGERISKEEEEREVAQCKSLGCRWLGMRKKGSVREGV